MERFFYILGTLWLTVSIVGGAVELAKQVHPALGLVVVAVGLVCGFIVPAITYLVLEEIVGKYDNWKDK